jgi:hypothetical protein
MSTDNKQTKAIWVGPSGTSYILATKTDATISQIGALTRRDCKRKHDARHSLGKAESHFCRLDHGW